MVLNATLLIYLDTKVTDNPEVASSTTELVLLFKYSVFIQNDVVLPIYNGFFNPSICILQLSELVDSVAMLDAKNTAFVESMLWHDGLQVVEPVTLAENDVGKYTTILPLPVLLISFLSCRLKV